MAADSACVYGGGAGVLGCQMVRRPKQLYQKKFPANSCSREHLVLGWGYYNTCPKADLSPQRKENPRERQIDLCTVARICFIEQLSDCPLHLMDKVTVR